jgi:hypothetical protein
MAVEPGGPCDECQKIVRKEAKLHPASIAQEEKSTAMDGRSPVSFRFQSQLIPQSWSYER